MGAKYEIVTITTPKKNLLYGLWSSAKKPKRAIIFIHGLSSSAFTLEKVISFLADNTTSILKFNNRGAGVINRLNKVDKRKKKGYTLSKIAGAAHEVFTECVDDIQGAVNFVKEKGVKDIYLVGHSTGCQKAIFYLSKKGKQKQVNGVTLLCPVSDYSAAVKMTDKIILSKAVKYALNLVSKGKKNEILPDNVWKDDIVDAQRFLSLYTPDSEEEIFTYVNSNKIPKTLRKVKIPIFAVFAGKDEYHDRPTKKIVSWFEKNSKSQDLTIKVVENSPHSFQDHKEKVSKEIQKWLNGQ